MRIYKDKRSPLHLNLPRLFFDRNREVHMKYTIIYGHPNPKSFNAAIKDRVEAHLKAKNREYAVRDIYGMNFNAILSGSDFATFRKGQVPDDIKREQGYIASADRLILIHPIWWFGMPAAMKGYIDRVFAKGFAYDYGPKGPIGLLTGKSAIVINTTGGSEDDYRNHGFKDAIVKTIDDGSLGFCGIKVTEHPFFYAVPAISDGERKKMLESIDGLEL